MNWILNPLKNYAQLNGRARRTEFIVFSVFVTLITLLAIYIDQRDGQYTPIAGGMEMLQLIVAIALLLPTLALAVRRLHDTDRAGWWIMLYYVPQLGLLVAGDDEALRLVSTGAVFLGSVTLLVLLLLPGTNAPNKYGASPR
jgi:uncharacterized membrane protein YhaH (DUF805 family)